MSIVRIAPVAVVLCALLIASGSAGGETVIVEGVDRYRVCEPLFECVRVVLSHRGEAYSPEYLQGISGAAFRIAGPCPCAPTCSSAMWPTGLIELLGYECEVVKVLWDDREERAPQVLARVRDEIRRGRPVIVWNAFTFYEYDVVCGFDEDAGELIGRGSYVGMEDYTRADEMRLLGGLDVTEDAALIIGERTGDFDARAAELDALEEAVHHAHSARDRWLDEAPDADVWRFREGLAAWDAWIGRYRRDPAREPDNGDRYCLGVYMSSHRAAAGFLRELAPKYPQVSEDLEEAAAHFAAEADALDELRAMAGWCWDREPTGDPEDGRRAAELLTRARDAYAQAIDAVERALQQIAPERAERARRITKLRRDEGAARVEIGDMAGLRRTPAHSFASALSTATRVTEHPYVVHEVMGLTGLAFRVRWCNEQTRTQWCPSCAIGEMPDEIALARQLTGWELRTEWLEQDGRDSEALQASRVADIDAGRPVLVYPPGWNVGIAHGYEDGGRTLLVGTWESGGTPVRLSVEELGPLIVHLGEHRQPPSLLASLLEALRAAVTNWHRERHHGGLPGREYWYGDAALGAWLGDLQGFEGISAETRRQLFDLDAWNLLSLVDARTAAVSLLGDYAQLVDGEARAALTEAAGLYRQETELLQPILDGREGAGRSADTWTAEERSAEVVALSEARALEATAVAAIERALALVE